MKRLLAALLLLLALPAWAIDAHRMGRGDYIFDDRVFAENVGAIFARSATLFASASPNNTGSVAFKPVVGRIYHIVTGGILTRGDATTFTYQVYADAARTKLVCDGGLYSSLNQASYNYLFDVYLTFTAIGASGATNCNGIFQLSTSADPQTLIGSRTLNSGVGSVNLATGTLAITTVTSPGGTPGVMSYEERTTIIEPIQ